MKFAVGGVRTNGIDRDSKVSKRVVEAKATNNFSDTNRLACLPCLYPLQCLQYKVKYKNNS